MYHKVNIVKTGYLHNYYHVKIKWTFFWITIMKTGNIQEALREAQDLLKRLVE